MIPHRSAAMELLMQTVHQRLQPLFGTARPVYVVTGSATAAMEMAVRCGSVERVLALVCGAFGERFAQIAELTGREVTRVIAEPGQVVSPEQVRLALENGNYDTVTVVHSETSTGALSDVASIATVVRESSNAMLMVDAVTSVGAMPIEMDAWGADLVFTGSQKALALPPGLAFVAASERLLNRARTLSDCGYALDLGASTNSGTSPRARPRRLSRCCSRSTSSCPTSNSRGCRCDSPATRRWRAPAGTGCRWREAAIWRWKCWPPRANGRPPSPASSAINRSGWCAC